jgi:hypothetical protein
LVTCPCSLETQFTSPVSKINGTSRASDISAPVMIINRILLVYINFKELAMVLTFIVLIPCLDVSIGVFKNKGEDLRVQLLEVGLYKIVLDNFNKLTFPSIVWDKVSLGFKGAEVYLSNKLYCEGWSQLVEVMAIIAL